MTVGSEFFGEHTESSDEAKTAFRCDFDRQGTSRQPPLKSPADEFSVTLAVEAVIDNLLSFGLGAQGTFPSPVDRRGATGQTGR
ncbi:hypothetical protein ACH495_14285 [Micromonospora sp. NPDC018662]|uniref:hypothetical protein n=1 Tax=Micromonospora sp. NPDC018662 TaxID=3364238 RepID=UPI003797E845